jgi:hypothetical protein
MVLNPLGLVCTVVLFTNPFCLLLVSIGQLDVCKFDMAGSNL